MAQAPLTCDICQSDEDVKFFCINCEEVLCSQCKVYHLRGKRTKNDEVVLLAEARQPNIGKSPVILCDKHPKQDISLYCQKCDEFICTECLAGSHNTHSVRTLQDIKSSKTNELKSQIKTLGGRTSVYDAALDREGKAHDQATQSIEQCKKEVLDQKAKIFAEVTNLCDEQLRELCLLQEQEDERYACACDLIHKQKIAVLTVKEEIQQGIDSGNPVAIMKATKDAEKFIQREKDPSQPVTNITRFRAGDINRPAVSTLQGKVYTENQEDAIPGGQNEEMQESINVKHQIFQPQERVTAGARRQQTRAVSRLGETSTCNKYKVVRKIKLKSRTIVNTIKTIIAMKDLLWVVINGNKHITLIDKEGEIINRSIDLCSKIISDAKAYNNEILVTCVEQYQVFKLSKDAKTKTIFSNVSPFHTNGLCVTDNMNVLVCLKHSDKTSTKVVRLGPTGNILQTIQDIDSSTELYVEPYRVTSLQSGEVIVTYKGTRDNKVVCTDRDGNHLFTWKGEIEGRVLGKFNPCHINYDQYKLFVTDCNGNRVYALNIDGRKAECILDKSEGIVGPFGLAVKEEQLFLGCWEGALYVVEY